MPAPIDLSQTPARTAPPKGIFGGNPKSRGTGLAIDEYARKVLWIAIFASLLIVGYLLAGLFTGAWDKTAMGALPHVDRLRQMQNIDFAFRALQTTALVLVVSLLICCLRDESIGYVLVGVGLLFYAGLPFLTAQVYQFRVFKTSVATATVLTDFQILSWLFFIPGVIWTVGDLLRRFRDASDAAAVQRANLKYGATIKKQVVQQKFLGRCWELPYCRENIRQKCPVYIKRRGPCWWHKEGCMCEERIILQAVITSDWKQKAAQADMAYNFGNKRVPLSPAALRQRCRTCVIYNEHQRQKYKAMVAIALVLVPVLLYLNAPLLQSGTVHILSAMEAVMNRFSYDNSTTGISFLHGRPSLAIEWVLIGAICVMILSQVLRFIEFWCFKLKI